METYFDSHLDLLQRQLSKHSDRLKMKAEEKFNNVLKKNDVLTKLKSQSGDLLPDNVEKEMQKFKLKVRYNLYTCSYIVIAFILY